MLESYYVGAYWGNRKESVEECAERAIRLLCALVPIDEIFGRWFEKGWSLKKALAKEVQPDRERLRGLFEKGRNRRDDNRAVIEDLGFRIGIWNGGNDAEDQVGLSLKCGCYASSAMTWIPNSCVINLPKGGPAAERIIQAGTLKRVMSDVVRSMDPDWGVVASAAHLGLVPQPPPGVPAVSWLTYLSARYGKIPDSLSRQASKVDGMGSLVVVTEERFTASNPGHVAAAAAIRDTLDRADLLRRIS